MTDLLKVFILNSQYLFKFVESNIINKKDVINFMNVNSKIRNDILSYYERSFKLEFPNLINIKNKNYLFLYFDFKLSKISKNVIDCINLDLKLSFSERIIFISPNIEFTDENFELSPVFSCRGKENSIMIEKDFYVNNKQNIFRKEISEIHKKIYKMLIFFDYSKFDTEYKTIYEKFGFYSFDLNKFKKLESNNFFEIVEKSQSYKNNSFNWDCFSKGGLRVISEDLLCRTFQIKNFKERIKNVLNITDLEQIIDTLECKEEILFKK